MKYLIIIPARKQSKEIKNKNKIRIGKLSLIEYTLIETIKSKFNYKICLSTNDKDIINIAKNYNIIAPFLRPSNLSKDNTFYE